MSQPSTITAKNDTLLVAGDLTFVTVMQLWNASLSLLAQQSKLEFDFSQVAISDSAGVALMVEWLKYAKQTKKSIRFQHIPAQLESIIAISGIQKLL